MSVETDLNAARELARAGVRLFLARPDPARRTGYREPIRWETAPADPAVVDAWQPGMALCAVMGGPLDLVDLDPRNAQPGVGLPTLPPYLARARTPSGGEHRFVHALGLPSLDGVAPGLDYKGGDPTGNGRGYAFIAPTVRLSKVDGQPHAYQWTDPPSSSMILGSQGVGSTIGYDDLRAAILARRETRSTEQPRIVPESVAIREWHAALERLSSDLAHWKVNGWGGEAHAGLLAHTMHLARLSPEHAEDGFRACFTWAGLTPDADDLTKLESALARAVPDVVVPDTECDDQTLFWAGAEPAERPGPAPDPVQADPAGGGAPFAFRDPGELDRSIEPPRARWGAFSGAAPLLYAEGVHWLQGESESGKTWVALALLVEVLRAGERAILVDHEDDWHHVLERLRALGVRGEELGRLVYVEGHDVAHADLVAHLAGTDRGYALMVLDGVTSALTAARLSGRDEQELTAWADAVPRRARMAVCVDHVVKNPDERNGQAIGSQAKKSVVTGTAFEVRCRDKFGRGASGSVELRLQKDKRGAVRALGRSTFRLRVECRADGSVALLASGAPGSTESVQETYFGAELPAEKLQRVRELVEVFRADPWSHAGRSMRALVARLGELNHAADDKVKRQAVRAFLADAGVPANAGPEVE